MKGKKTSEPVHSKSAEFRHKQSALVSLHLNKSS